MHGIMQEERGVYNMSDIESIYYDKNLKSVFYHDKCDKYDYLICMDSQNVRALLRILGGDPRNKVRKLLDFTGRGGDIPDPWYSGRFDSAYRDISAGCEALLQILL